MNAQLSLEMFVITLLIQFEGAANWNIKFNFLLNQSVTGWGVLGPFVAIHMKSLGISVEETGIIYGIASVVSVLTPVGLGLIADKLGNFKVITIDIIYNDIHDLF
jgi:MFS family permease